MKITVSVAQMEVERSDPPANLAKAEGLIHEAAGRGSDLVCLPEMWTTGFDWERNRKMAAGQGTVVELVAALAREHRIWVSGSMLTAAGDGGVLNTHILFGPGGEKKGVYNKSHLFTMIHEEEHETAGDSFCLAEAPWGPTGLAVCYDLRFPEMFRTYALRGAVLVLLPAAFPYPRLEHWKVLLRARAIEDQMFVVGTNQVGEEDLGANGRVTYFGASAVIDPWGEPVAEASEGGEELLTATIDLGMVDEIRGRMTVLRDRRPELYQL